MYRRPQKSSWRMLSTRVQQTLARDILFLRHTFSESYSSLGNPIPRISSMETCTLPVFLHLLQISCAAFSSSPRQERQSHMTQDDRANHPLDRPHVQYYQMSLFELSYPLVSFISVLDHVLLLHLTPSPLGGCNAYIFSLWLSLMGGRPFFTFLYLPVSAVRLVLHYGAVPEYKW